MNGKLQNAEIHPAAERKPELSRWVWNPIDGTTIHGVENELKVLQKMLGKRHGGGGGGGNGFRAIGIVGVRGIGKSTICQALLQNPQVKSEFLPRIWVSMSTNFTEDSDPKMGLVKRILSSLGMGENFLAGQTLGGLLYALRLQLRGKRYLIVLDDAKELGAEEQNWYSDLNRNCSSEGIGENLRDGFPKGDGIGGAVIVTSRSENFAKAMVGDKNLLCLAPQKDPESLWEIFRQEFERDGNVNPSNLKELKVELLNKCGGLPLVAKMMGQIKCKGIANSKGIQQQN